MLEGGDHFRTLRDIRGLLRFQQSMGIAAYPLNDGIRRFFAVADGVSLKARSAGDSGVGAKTRQERPRADQGGAASTILAVLRQEIEQCSLCRLAECRKGTSQGRGIPGSSLMVVGDWSAQENEPDPAILFGAEEDVMLWKMMEAIALQPEEVYVTNLLKCCPGGTADDGCRESCFSYLIREIAAVKPRLICAMGDFAVRMLAGTAEPLFRVRGRFVEYRLQGAGAIPVMPTFHPRYLIRNPEMKMATWKDLQAIRRRLDQQKS
ncbi:MAG: hypothetical protein C4563_10375 [Desulfobulbus sp.]|nr:MAG: hypothetical protein C4563_10375 [Desulfobulbus sp.]